MRVSKPEIHTCGFTFIRIVYITVLLKFYFSSYHLQFFLFTLDVLMAVRETMQAMYNVSWKRITNNRAVRFPKDFNKCMELLNELFLVQSVAFIDNTLTRINIS